MRKTLYGTYRFFGIGFILIMAFSGLVRRHVVMLRGADLYGTEAFAFGLFWLFVATGLIFVETLLFRAKGSVSE